MSNAQFNGTQPRVCMVLPGFYPAVWSGEDSKNLYPNCFSRTSHGEFNKTHHRNPRSFPCNIYFFEQLARLSLAPQS
jgi:hypothetical protein